MANREQLVGEWIEYLTGEQERAARENPFGRFQSRIPAYVFKRFTQDEIRRMQTNEEVAYNRRLPLERAKVQQKRAWLAAGGDEAGFEEHWELVGKADTVQKSAEQKYNEWIRQSGFNQL